MPVQLEMQAKKLFKLISKTKASQAYIHEPKGVVVLRPKIIKMIREVPTLKLLTNLLIFKIATGEQEVLNHPLREEIKLYLEDDVSRYNPRPSHLKDVLKEQQAVI
ncbi:hypothetical protein FDZ14_29985 (plasmid) [Priestia megaterium]|uniref:Uncharacterized protein n=1 Tax=Priestia megaterium TaxID=1404 RepID=A0A6M6E3Y4_PRIMG|nr:hypothetical protein FDZ14_29985 [Priestia megaterium]